MPVAMRASTSAILLAAGKSTRFRKGVSKPLAMVGSRPIIAYSLSVLQAHPAIRDIVVVVNKHNRENIARLIRRGRFSKVHRIVLGGMRRQDSVRKGLEALPGKSALVLIHDAARPFIDARAVSSVVSQARRAGAAVVAVPVKATIKKVAGRTVKETVRREGLWEAQTPQAFDRETIIEAHRRFGRESVTDDAMLAEKLGVRPKIVEGSYFNIKVTTPEDMVVAEAIAKEL